CTVSHTRSAKMCSRRYTWSQASLTASNSAAGPIDVDLYSQRSPDRTPAIARAFSQKIRSIYTAREWRKRGTAAINASSAFIKGGSLSQQPEKILHQNSTKEWLSAAHRASVSSGDLPEDGGDHDVLCNSRRQRDRA